MWRARARFCEPGARSALVRPRRPMTPYRRCSEGTSIRFFRCRHQRCEKLFRKKQERPWDVPVAAKVLNSSNSTETRAPTLGAKKMRIFGKSAFNSNSFKKTSTFRVSIASCFWMLSSHTLDSVMSPSLRKLTSKRPSYDHMAPRKSEEIHTRFSVSSAVAANGSHRGD